MEYSEEMATSINDLPRRSLGADVERELDNYQYNQDVIPQATLQKAPPMRHGRVENFPTHQTVNNVYYPRDGYNQVPTQATPKKDTNFMTFNGIFDGLYQRIIDPIIIIVLFVIFAHRLVAKGITPYLPVMSMSPSTDILNLIIRGFVLSIIYLMIKNYL